MWLCFSPFSVSIAGVTSCWHHHSYGHPSPVSLSNCPNAIDVIIRNYIVFTCNLRTRTHIVCLVPWITFSSPFVCHYDNVYNDWIMVEGNPTPFYACVLRRTYIYRICIKIFLFLRFFLGYIIVFFFLFHIIIFLLSMLHKQTLAYSYLWQKERKRRETTDNQQKKILNRNNNIISMALSLQLQILLLCVHIWNVTIRKVRTVTEKQ